ncbi:TonB-dependent receptor [Sphingopyxis sp.]|uniref:TonB-dependent receptor n=1 Tax=Sphingopyxis sp. TaxID=1908224 RepID=UPI001D556419|nr:TonB-dependent receptor [Sphingopyxis sp.]MBW8297500.1 TonB-dependent receptor [Sphingopyxis sp.]
MTTRRYKAALVLTGSLLSFGFAAGALAQDAPPVGSIPAPDAQTETEESRDRTSVFGEILVTAQRREERLQDVPVAITAFSGDMIDKLGFDNVLDVATQTPGFQVGGLGGSNNSITPWLNIRGIQFTDTTFVNESSVGLYVDEVYIPFPGAGVQQLFDVERIEVLKGPQGSLFGRNSSTGLVQFVTRKPTDEFEGHASLTVGQYGKIGGEAAINLPAGEGIRIRLAGQYAHNDGYRKNPETGIDTFGKVDAYGLRGTAAIDLMSNLELTVSGHYARGDNIFPGRDLRGTRVPGNTGVRCADPRDVFNGLCSTRNNFINDSDNPRITYSVLDNPVTYRSYGGYAKLELVLDDVTITSLTGAENWKSFFQQDTGFGAQSFNNVTSDFLNRTHSFSQELRANGKRGDVSWVLGAYYYRDNRYNQGNVFDWYAATTPGVIPSSATQGREGRVKSKSVAVFAHVEAEIIDRVTLLVGGRYTSESRDLVRMRFYNGCRVGGTCPLAIDGSNTADFKNFSGDLTLRWKPSDDVMTYVKYARGFKSGGWNPSAPTLFAAGPADPEIVDEFEFGLKADLIDRRLRTNLALFTYNFDGLQSTLSQIVNGVAINNFVNAGSAKIKGAELEAVITPFDNFELSLGGAYLDTEITRVATGGLGILPGNRLPNAPKWTANGVARYGIELGSLGRLTLQGEFTHKSSVFFTVDNDPYRTMTPYMLYNARLIFDSADDVYSAQLSIENIANKRYATGAFQTAGFDSMYFEPGLPRWVSFKVSAKF